MCYFSFISIIIFGVSTMALDIVAIIEQLKPLVIKLENLRSYGSAPPE